MKTPEETYIELFGVCPSIEKEIPLHSQKDVVKAIKTASLNLLDEMIKEYSLDDDYRNVDIKRWAENKKHQIKFL